MLIIPAIDLRQGRCVRLVQGDYDRELSYDADPLETSFAFADAGARLVHVVDLDGARLGAPQDWTLIERLAKGSPIPIEFGGGVRSLETAQRLFDLGVSRVVIGSALTGPPEVAQSFLALGERVVAGLDARDGDVATQGWTEASGQSVVDLALLVQSLGAQRVILTDIARDGMLSGPNIALFTRVASAVQIPVIHSGGIGELSHLAALFDLSTPPEGVIVGRSLYEGRLSLAEAISRFQQPATGAVV